MDEQPTPPADTARTPTAVVEEFNGGPGVVLRLEQTPDPTTVRVHDLHRPGRDVPVDVRGRNVRRRAGYFGRGRGRWQVTYLPKNDTAHQEEQ